MQHVIAEMNDVKPQGPTPAAALGASAGHRRKCPSVGVQLSKAESFQQSHGLVDDHDSHECLTHILGIK